MRKFCIFEEPHKADPAWIAPVVELLDNESYKNLATADELQKVVWKLQFDLGREAGRTREAGRASQYLRSIGCTKEQIRAFHFYKPESTENVQPPEGENPRGPKYL